MINCTLLICIVILLKCGLFQSMAKHAPHLHLHYSLYHHLLILPFPPYGSNFSPPSSCFSSSSSSSFNLSLWFIGGGAQFTHIPLTTTPPPPLLPSHRTLISRRGRLSSSSSNGARKRVSERNETIGGVLFSLSGPERLLCTSIFSLRPQGVVTKMCVSFFILSIGWLYLYPGVKVSRPVVSGIEESLKSSRRSFPRSRFRTHTPAEQTTHAERTLTGSVTRTLAFAHAGTPHPQTHNPQIPIAAHPR